ncbi:MULTISPECIES: hypothetical protein [Dolichospermum]|jgi:hypothetical protein|uniref:Uncharacterized protein n=1 Tax=Dolichospermum flos-aquae CCAP 1403/13F TaxID=315271 RepID=A0A6H2C537_DOLFA|nr:MULTISPECIES: hypothetical protein [Dolichospermum]MBO1052521.1 hypothetical protein [Dolichospermum sp. DET73]MTJ19008.1 hypothetical protein [Dolichospermum sp. UHCC 0299]MTJ40536.1 hypothetical protein [Dolichospermum sp. UHCC 0406]QJB46410.1 hypothetical protein HGD76_21730 [Dolichospermum flos-aquae CCAP 1403/13F]
MAANFSWTPEGKNFLNQAESLNNSQKVPIFALFNSEFMQKHTNFLSFESMLETSNFKIDSAEDFMDISEFEWEHFIKKSTSFSSWEEMKKIAAVEWTKNHLGLS